MSRKRMSLIFALILIAMMVAPAIPASASNGSRYYAQTNHWVRGAFLDFFDRYGGVNIFGYPITEEFLEDSMTVQYFEKARFEWRPWNADPYKVELTLLGYNIHGPADPAVSSATCTWQWGCRYFPETGHTVSGSFVNFFNSYGSLTVFGYPITEPFAVENGITIQYFQRARMELYPGDSHVYLGNLGTEWLNRTPKWPGTIQPPASTTTNVHYFAETGYNVQGAFLDYWNAHGQLDTFGYPISGEFTEGGYTVQYFQRARMEWHPENADPYRVQLGLLGEALHGPAEPAVPNWVTPWSPRARYFAMTGHIVTEGFLDFFDQHGGVEIFGYPITEAQMEGGYVVQWFQRAKMEWHPENRDPYKVQLALLGSIAYGGPPAAQSQWEPIMGFGKVWRDNPTVKNGLGVGLEEQRTTGATEQKMQGGVFFWREDTDTIYAMSNDGTWRAYADTWIVGVHPEAWGYNPPAGLYEAIRGFGKLWREQLGGPNGVFHWGAEPERGFTGTAQAFEKGLMLENDRKEIFVLFNTGNWVKYADMY